MAATNDAVTFGTTSFSLLLNLLAAHCHVWCTSMICCWSKLLFVVRVQTIIVLLKMVSSSSCINGICLMCSIFLITFGTLLLFLKWAIYLCWVTFLVDHVPLIWASWKINLIVILLYWFNVMLNEYSRWKILFYLHPNGKLFQGFWMQFLGNI